jgi:tetratricopeptide (TPR) repeat protein
VADPDQEGLKGPQPHALREQANIESLSKDLVEDGACFGRRYRLSFGHVNARIWLVLCLAELGRLDEATVLGQEASDLARRVNGPEELIFAGLGVGRMHLVQGNLNNAVEALEPALALCKSAGFPVYNSRVASSLGGAYASLGRIDEALVLLEAAVQQARVNNFMFGHSLVLSHFGRACHLAGRQEEAVAHSHSAIDVARASGERGNEAWAWRLLGDAASDGSATASIPEAESHYNTALMITHELGMRPLRARCLYGLSRLYKKAGNQALAEQHATDAVSLCRQIGMQTRAD